MTPAELARSVADAVRRAVEEGALDVAVPDAAAVRLTRGRGAGRGSWATGVALRLAGPAGLPAPQVAERIARRLTADGIARADVAGPGFLNITLAPAAHAALVRTVRDAGPRYGHGDALAGEPAAAAVPVVTDPRSAPAVPAVPAVPAAAAVPATDPRSAATVRIRRACGAAADPPGAVTHPAFDTLGVDAGTWALVRPPAGDPPDLRPATHLPQRTANPLFRVRYAHARARALVRNAADLGFTPAEGEYPHPAEERLLGVIGDWPRVVGTAARHRAPDRVARALEGTADAFLDFHDAVAVLPSGEEKPSAAHRSRLALADAAATVLAGGLSLLGVSAPDHL